IQVVVDFSDAQRLGFIDAFVDFMFQVQKGQQSQEELHCVAQTLLKGCEYHDDKSVTRVAHIGEVVPSETEAHFKGLCRKMRVTEDEKEFEKVVDILYREWPLISPWLDWWLAPEHGGMIFPTRRKMSAEVANRLPSTTNAEEAMHSTVYKIAGKGNVEKSTGTTGCHGSRVRVRVTNLKPAATCTRDIRPVDPWT
ncbi:hypothetical protein K435DRAFT_698742, partial [Dendrothele bispora CBS 962.96]